MCAIGLPGPTFRTPLRTTVKLAYKDVFAIKGLESRAVRVHVWRYPWLRFDVPPTCLFLPLPAFCFECFSLRRKGDETGIKLDSKERSEVAREGQNEEQEIEHN